MKDGKEDSSGDSSSSDGESELSHREIPETI